MPRPSVFTGEQDAYIQTVCRGEWEVVLNDARTSANSKSQWRQEKASEIFHSPLFATLDLGSSRRSSGSRIGRKLLNYKNHRWVPSQRAPATAAPPEPAPTGRNPLLPNPPTARQLFADSQRDVISANMRGSSTASRSSYQTVLSELWGSLSDAEKDGWGREAAAQAGDIAQNQRDLPGHLALAFRRIIASRRFGDLEIFCAYGMRTPSDILDTGVINSHNPGNAIHFGGTDIERVFGRPWGEYCARVLPQTEGPHDSADAPRIPTNANGIPVFPANVNVDNTGLVDLMTLLAEYLTAVWVYANADLPVAWDDLGRRYDDKYKLSAPLRHPQSLGPAEVISLCRDFQQLGALPEPFAFLAGPVALPPPPPPPPSTLATARPVPPLAATPPPSTSPPANDSPTPPASPIGSESTGIEPLTPLLSPRASPEPERKSDGARLNTPPAEVTPEPVPLPLPPSSGGDKVLPPPRSRKRSTAPAGADPKRRKKDVVPTAASSRPRRVPGATKAPPPTQAGPSKRVLLKDRFFYE
ncbi:hypothetical protein MKEN_00217800 [Mycena kentingensis (nom. inval.)]|nr:hypothetical protein MKEN_00217800 [Mycena kentingensis (nom. inval.)]